MSIEQQYERNEEEHMKKQYQKQIEWAEDCNKLWSVTYDEFREEVTKYLEYKKKYESWIFVDSIRFILKYWFWAIILFLIFKNYLLSLLWGWTVIPFIISIVLFFSSSLYSKPYMKVKDFEQVVSLADLYEDRKFLPSYFFEAIVKLLKESHYGEGVMQSRCKNVDFNLSEGLFYLLLCVNPQKNSFEHDNLLFEFYEWKRWPEIFLPSKDRYKSLVFVNKELLNEN